jgi:UDP-N-acetylmuramoylalanine--D-glutamate ligase
MRPTISWSDLKGAAVGVWGVGVEGQANVRKLKSLGVRPVLVDDRPAADNVVATDQGGLDALRRCEVVVKAPGISRYRADVAALTEAGTAVVGGLGLWLQEADRGRVVCITGTKGKSTTSAIAGHLLNRLGHRTLVGGNLGKPPWDPDLSDDFDYWVIEVSSFQATDIAASPPVVAVTSLHPDHLDWHGGDPEHYYRDKLSLCTQPGADLTIANGDSDLLRARRDLLGPRVEWVGADDDARDADAAWAEPLGLIGGHNRRNARIARACIEALGVAVDGAALADAAAGFVPLESRLTPIAKVDGVLFVDDSLSTNVLPTLAALDAFADQPVALIAGGFDRGIDYTALGDGIAARTEPTLVVALPATGRRIGAAVAGRVPVLSCRLMTVAVYRAFTWAKPRGGVVLLSPAAPSFGQFKDYRERSAAFASAVTSLAV